MHRDEHQITPLREDDLPALAAIRQATDEADGRQPRTDRRLLPDFQATRDTLLVRTGAGRVVGWTELLLSPRQGANIDGAVHPDFRRQGIGRRLLRAAED